MEYTTYINGATVPHGEILAWERKRLAAVISRFKGAGDTHGCDLDTRSSILTAVKQTIGYEEIVRRLRVGLALSSASAKVMNALSFGQRRVCVTEMVVQGFTAVEVAHGIESLMLEHSAEHEIVNLGACPDHYVLRPLGCGRLEVIETTGGSPFPVQFFIDYGSEKELSIARDTAYPYQSAGVARLGDGTVIGGVRHQFRDEGSGFRARLAVEFPLIAPGYLIHQHQLHLACEFGHWFQWLFACSQEKSPVGVSNTR